MTGSPATTRIAVCPGSLLYISPEYHLNEDPGLLGIIIAANLIGAALSSFIAGGLADWLGRRSLLLVMATFYIAGKLSLSHFGHLTAHAIAQSSLLVVGDRRCAAPFWTNLALLSGAAVEAWSPSILILIVGRVLVGLSVGLVATVVPLFISECSPASIRGQLATLPQLMGIAGMLVAYIVVFSISLTPNPNWRFMLGLSLAPGVFYFALAISTLPESPAWLVSKGRMKEAREVLRHLRGELAMLVEGLAVAEDSSLEEWLVKPNEETIRTGTDPTAPGEKVLLGPEDGVSYIAKRAPDGGDQHPPVLTPVGTLESSFQVHHLVQIMDTVQHLKEQAQPDQTDEVDMFPDGNDEEYEGKEQDEDVELGVVGALDEALTQPLLPQQTEGNLKAKGLESDISITSSTLTGLVSQSALGNALAPYLPALQRYASSDAARSSIADSGHEGTGTGGSWQVAWVQDTGKGRANRPDRGVTRDCSGDAISSYKRVFFLSEGSNYTSTAETTDVLDQAATFNADGFQAAALVSRPIMNSGLLEEAAGPALVHPAKTASSTPSISDLNEPGVKQALFVGLALQALQQACGINAVLYYTPVILSNSAGDVLAQLGLSQTSSSILASGSTCAFMLPCVFLAMWLMDRAGRRQLLLSTIPVMAVALLLLVLSTALSSSGLLGAIAALVGVLLFSCSFVMGFGPIPNIICSEIFPTRVRGLCIGLCAATMWTFNIAVSQAFPYLMKDLGLGITFGLFAVMSVISWVFIYLRVPETKGLPLEVICEIFAMAAARDGSGPPELA
eukprot:SM000243S08597  [mRNA]  locus=s243:43736:47022:- [translate_table: standard]